MLKNFNKYLIYILPLLFVVLSLWSKVGYGLLLTMSIILSAYFAYLFFLKKKAFNPKFWIITNICLAILLVGIPFVISPGSKTNSSTNQKIDCSSSVGKYQGKTLQIVGNKVKGKVLLTEDTAKCKIIAHYLFVFTVDLPENKVGALPYLYNYTGLIGNKDSLRTEMTGSGSIFALERNSTAFPIDISNSQEVSKFYGAFSGPLGVTPVPFFFSNFSIDKELSEKGYSKIFDDNWFGIVDLKPYMIKTGQEGGGFVYTPDTKKAELSGTIVKEFNFEILE